MQEIVQALDEVKTLYETFVGRPAPVIDPESFLPFQPGVDPIRQTLEEVGWLKQLSEQWKEMPAALWAPRADTWASPDTLLLHVELPGVAREDVKVSIVGNELIVRGERKAFGPAHDMRPIGIERPWGAFERRFPIPLGAQTDRIAARYTHGMLELRLPIEPIRPPAETPVEVS